MQLPEPVRRKDPNLKFKPYYKISNDNYAIQIGADVLTISSFPKYTGWTEFQQEINYFLLKINELSTNQYLYLDEKFQIDTIINLSMNLIQNSKNIESEYVDIVNENFWDLI